MKGGLRSCLGLTVEGTMGSDLGVQFRCKECNLKHIPSRRAMKKNCVCNFDIHGG